MYLPSLLRARSGRFLLLAVCTAWAAACGEPPVNPPANTGTGIDVPGGTLDTSIDKGDATTADQGTGDVATSGDTTPDGSTVGTDDAVAGDQTTTGDAGGCIPTTPPTEVCDFADNDCNGKTDEATCDDKNVCTVDLCKAVSATAADQDCSHEPKDGPCDDGTACVTGEACAAGVCKGTALECDDKEPCTVDSCDPKDGCKNAGKEGACEDGSVCTEGDACKDAKCVSGAAKVCDDKNPCTDDLCDKSAGCKATNNTAACDDGSACTKEDACKDGNCAGGVAVVCDDKNACTKDSCDLAAGCTATATTDPCDDASKCTTGDACADGKCAGTQIICDDNNPCTTDSCDPLKGCSQAPGDGAACDDGNACTVTDFCKDSKCLAGEAKTCDDTNVCTDDACDVAAGCTTTANDKLCEDGDKCTTGDACKAGKCATGGAASCDDSNPCTVDSCDTATGCKQTASPGACDDGDACTAKESCTDNKCQGGTPVVCDDKNACTDDACDPKAGCSAVANTVLCDDGNACTTGDVCAATKCAGADKKVCDDGNPCTADACDPKVGCTATPTGAPCDDDDACTEKDVCKDGKCQSGAAKVCDDKNPCTNDGCDEVKGCVAVNNSASCDDANLCFDKDVCVDGVCKLGPKATCDDGKACTDDTCDPAKGCAHKPNDANKCDDGNGCTALDACKAGVCAGIGIPCDDKNPCTDDICTPIGGCKPVANAKPCDDAKPCTVGEACKTGICGGGLAKVCDDGNGCTADSCDPVKGCVFAPIAACSGVPYAVAFNCKDPNSDAWKLDAPLGALGWALDESPNPPGAKSAPCSLNYNNGKDFQCPIGSPFGFKLNASATSPLIDATKVKAGTLMRVVFQRAGAWEANAFDNLDIESSIDGGKTWKAVNLTALDPWAQPTWNTQVLDITSLSGAAFQLRVRFSTTDCVVNTQAGPFIDSLVIQVGGCKDAAGCNDNNVCTNDVCDAATGKCTHIGNSVPCDDGTACTTGEACAGGLCKPGIAKKCDDLNPCTNDACDLATGCTATANTAVCDDGNACTDKDACAAGKCVPGATKVCDDKNLCTGDACDSKTGCINKGVPGVGQPACDGTVVNGRCYKAVKANLSWATAEKECVTWGGGGHLVSMANLTENQAARSVANTACGVGASAWIGLNDAAAEGKYVWTDGTAPSYFNWNFGEPNNSGNEDAVEFFPDGKWNDIKATDLRGCYVCERTAPVPCDDGTVCTAPDLCDATAKCVPGAVKKCDDGNACTTDSCDPVKGCVNAINTLACDDGNACTDKDVCKDAKCGPGLPKVCDDAATCTTDSCDKVKGCVNAPVAGSGIPACDGEISGGRCYKAFKGVQTWDNAEAACKAWGGGGHLTSIANLTENALVRKNADLVCGVNKTTAIGLNDVAVEGKYVWIDGTVSTYTNWLPGQPDNAGNEDHVGMWNAPGWNDFPATWGYDCYVCERNAPVPCNDGSACSTQDVCDATGKCVGALPLKCDDANVCTADSCDPKVGCVHMPVTVTTPCDDGNACTDKDVCGTGTGKCAAGTPKVCNDNSVCTTDGCDPKTGCTVVPAPGAGAPLCDGTVVNGRCYKAFKADKKWADAETACKAWGGDGHLASIADGGENTAVRAAANSACGTTVAAFIGANDIVTEKTFLWTDGSKFVFTNWATGEPNNIGEEDVTEQGVDGKWNDLKAADLRACYVCERTAPPTCDDASSCTDKDICNAQGKCAGSTRDFCVAGPKFAATCSATVGKVCAVDGFCCSTAWDDQCVAKVPTTGGYMACSNGTGKCAHNMCVAGAKLVANCDVPPLASGQSCVGKVCAADGFCCNTAWDGSCVNQVATVCKLACK